MGRRPLLPYSAVLARRDSRMAPGGRMHSESPVRARRGMAAGNPPNNGWRYLTTANVPSATGGYSQYFPGGLAYGDGLYVYANGYYGVSSSTSLEGPWTYHAYTFSGAGSNLGYGDGKWILCDTGYGGSDKLWYASTGNLSAWAQKSSIFGFSCNVYRAQYNPVTNVWVAMTQRSSDGNIYLATATTPSGTWTTHGPIMSGMFVSVSHEPDGTYVGAHLDGRVFTANTPGGTWTQRSRIVEDSYAVRNLAVSDSHVVALPWYPYPEATYVSTSVEGSWSTVQSGFTDEQIGMFLAYDGTQWIAASTYGQICIAFDPMVSA